MRIVRKVLLVPLAFRPGRQLTANILKLFQVSQITAEFPRAIDASPKEPSERQLSVEGISALGTSEGPRELCKITEPKITMSSKHILGAVFYG